MVLRHTFLKLINSCFPGVPLMQISHPSGPSKASLVFLFGAIISKKPFAHLLVTHVGSPCLLLSYQGATTPICLYTRVLITVHRSTLLASSQGRAKVFISLIATAEGDINGNHSQDSQFLNRKIQTVSNLKLRDKSRS